MRTTWTTMKPSSNLAWFLGYVSAVLGLALSLMWGLAFVVMNSHAAGTGHGPVGAGLSLPALPPLIGLGVALIGLAVGRVDGRPTPWSVTIGLVANIVPLALVVAWIVMTRL